MTSYDISFQYKERVFISLTRFPFNDIILNLFSHILIIHLISSLSFYSFIVFITQLPPPSSQTIHPSLLGGGGLGQQPHLKTGGYSNQAKSPAADSDTLAL